MRKITHAIIICDSCEHEGGAEAVALANAVGFAKKGIETIYFCSFGAPPEVLSSSCTVVSLNEESVQKSALSISNIARGFWNKRAYKCLGAILKSVPIETTAIFVHGWGRALSPSIFMALKREKAIFSVTLHEYSLVCANACLYDFNRQQICHHRPCSLGCLLCNCDKRNYAQKIYRYFRVLLLQHILKDCSYYTIRISEKQKEIFERTSLAPVPSISINNPVEIPEYIGVENNRGSYFLFVGRLTKEKDPDVFCRAVTEVGASGIVVGDGERRDELEKEYKSIHFTGWLSRSEVYSLMKGATALVVPSRWYEGSPLTVIEAQLVASLPVIVSESCNAAESIVNGKTGFIFKAGLDEDLADRIRRLMDPQIEMSMKTAVSRQHDIIQNRYGVNQFVAYMLLGAENAVDILRKE